MLAEHHVDMTLPGFRVRPRVGEQVEQQAALDREGAKRPGLLHGEHEQGVKTR
jgi:hypothetical protein